MSTIDQITYRARNGSSGIIYETATSVRDQAISRRWQRLLEPWLRIGKPPGRAFLDSGTQTAFIRWYATAASQFEWQYAFVLVGQSDVLTAAYALELQDPDLPALYRGSGQDPLRRAEQGPDRDEIEARARSRGAIELLIPLLAHALRGERRMTMPWTEPSLPDAVIWGLVSILEMIGDPQPVSFFTYDSCAGRDPDTAGLFVSFRPDAKTVLPPDPGFKELAADLAARFADDPAELRQVLAQHRMLEPADRASRIGRLLELEPRIRAESRHTGGTATVNASSDSPPFVRESDVAPSLGADGRGSRDTPGQAVTCPMCLHEIEDWKSLDYWRWEPAAEKYVDLPVPQDLSSAQLEHYLHGARVRCPVPQGSVRIGPHYLPADYGRFGPPVVLGFVGLTRSGKSHLLASMVGGIVGRELATNYGISASPLDHAWHRRFMDTWVSPLLRYGKVLPGTREGGVIEFADAFLIRPRGAPERVVALFDVAGGDLARLDETKQFLWIANGLFFVIDPGHMGAQWAEDETFSNVLDVLQKRARRPPASAAIVLNKADMVRFDEPVDRWLRSDGSVSRDRGLNPVEFLRESADVYAYLDAHNALAMAEPYEVCDKTTLHVASPTGGTDTGEGGVYPRGVTPRRVLRPLVAMLAMTGVLTGPDAEKVGV
jgi:hypothetical protein